MRKCNNLTWHHSTVTKKERYLLNGHKSCVLWFTGLSGSGKSTLANAVDHVLFHEHFRSYVLDGDNVRHGLNSDLSFQAEDRKENIRRIGEVRSFLSTAAKLFLLHLYLLFERIGNLFERCLKLMNLMKSI